MKKSLRFLHPSVLILLLVVVIASSCNTSKILQGDEKLLNKNSVVLDIPKKQGNARSLKYDLSTVIKQVPNTNYLLFFPREIIYYNNSQPDDTTRWKRLLKRTIGEKPAIFSEALANESKEAMKNYLQNNGFFDAEVDYTVKNVGKHKVNVTYTATTRNVYTIDSVFFKSRDRKVQAILDETQEETNLKKGRPVSEELFETEVSRLTTTLKNKGYFKFDRNFVDTLRGDSTGQNVNLYVEIFSPYGTNTEHQVFHIGQINIYPDYYPGDETLDIPDTLVDGLHFRSGESLKIKPRTISNSVFLKTGDLYSKENETRTSLQLNRLNNFRAISVVPKVDSIRQDIVNFDIYLTPRKKLEMGLDWEFNNSNYTLAGDRVSLLGTSIGANYRNWNLFRNATLLDHNIKAGIEFNLRNLDTLIYSADVSYTIGLYFPKFVPWTGPYKLLNKITVGKDSETGAPKKFINGFYQELKEKGKTRLTANLSFRNITTLYIENSYNATFGYEFQPNNQHRFLIDHTGINFYFLTNEQPLYLQIIQEDQYLQLSRARQLFTGLIFRDLNYTYTSKINQFGESWFLGTNFEISGAEAWAANKIYNGLTNRQDTFTILNDFEFEQYTKFELDLRYYRKYNENRSFAFRANTGIASPYGFSNVVPYVQQFYLGGGNSMRAWRIRELGPGAYITPDSLTTESIAFYQAGDFKLEFNAEYRFKLFGDFQGALFLDLGNIWSLDPEDSRGEESQFHLISGVVDNKKTEGFLNQIAIGTGFGLRWDFSYFILRFDMGLKLRNPNDSYNGRYWFPKWDKLQLRDINPNLAIGYPF